MEETTSHRGTNFVNFFGIKLMRKIQKVSKFESQTTALHIVKKLIQFRRYSLRSGTLNALYFRNWRNLVENYFFIKFSAGVLWKNQEHLARNRVQLTLSFPSQNQHQDAKHGVLGQKNETK